MKIFILFLLLIEINVWAADCKLDGLKFYSYSANVENGTTFELDRDGKGLAEGRNNSMLVSSCGQAVKERKSLIVALAPVEYEVSSKKSSANYIHEIRPDSCKIENSPFDETPSFQEKLERNKQKLKFINKCVAITITHGGTKPISFMPSQKDCKIEKVNNNVIKALGGKCVFNIFKDSSFKINYNIRKECLDPTYLENEKIDIKEYILKALVFTATDPFKSTIKKKYVGNKIIRFHMEPMSKMGPLSFNYDINVPRFFRNYYQPDIHLGGMTLTQTIRGPQLALPILVDNRCKKRCSGSLCTSPCDYTQPVVASFELFEVEQNGKKVFIDSWYSGGAAPDNFHGILFTRKRLFRGLNRLNSKMKYLIKASYVDPHFDYLMYKKSHKSVIAAMPGFPSGDIFTRISDGFTEMSGSSGLRSFGGLGEIG